MGRPIASAPEPTDAAGQPVSRLRCIPEDLATPLLTVEGAVLGEEGKLRLSAYEDLMRYYAREPLAEAHPDPARPGVRGDESVPKGLRMWDDVRALREGQNGAGWIAHYRKRLEPSKEKWFNIQTCGSWRLAFLLAQLQLRVWQRGLHGATAPRAVSARRITTKRKVEDSEILVKEPTIPKEPMAEIAEPLEPRAPPKPLIESSARLQQLLERVRAKESGKAAASPVKPEDVKDVPQVASKVSLLLAAAGERSPPPKQREVREPDSGEKLPKQQRLA